MWIRRCFLIAVFAAVPAMAQAVELAPIALNSLSHAPAPISRAQVYDQHGRVIGQVARVQADHDGKPSALSIRPSNGGQLVVVSAAAASYDQPRNVVITSAQDARIAELSRQADGG
jgi:hypothetical protein